MIRDKTLDIHQYDLASLFLETCIDIENIFAGRQNDLDAIRKSGALLVDFVERLIDVDRNDIRDCPVGTEALYLFIDAVIRSKLLPQIQELDDLKQDENWAQILDLAVNVAVSLDTLQLTKEAETLLLHLSGEFLDAQRNIPRRRFLVAS